MRPTVAIYFLLCLFPGPADYQAAISYFSNVRDVRVSSQDQQNYVVVDADLWKRARPDLADVRLYDGQTQVQYVLKERSGSLASDEQKAKMLNLGRVEGHTEFDLDLGPVPEYDRLRVGTNAQNFVITAHIEGRNSLNDRHAVRLGSGTLYDFTRENLGSNEVLKIPTSSFRYLHVSLGDGLRPDQLTEVFVSNLREEKAAWTNAGACRVQTQVVQKSTVAECQPDVAAPLDRISFQIAPESVNFRRTVLVFDSTGAEIARGTISRVKMNRNGQVILSENLALDLPGVRSKDLTELKITVENGDNASLPIQSIQLLSIERRIYFDPGRRSALKLYCGDPKLGPAAYDYATFFHEDAASPEAQLGPDAHNPEYAGRPDDRPWSERHTIVLWTAMILAVVTLAAVALRGFRTA